MSIEQVRKLARAALEKGMQREAIYAMFADNVERAHIRSIVQQEKYKLNFARSEARRESARETVDQSLVLGSGHVAVDRRSFDLIKEAKGARRDDNRN